MKMNRKVDQWNEREMRRNLEYLDVHSIDLIPFSNLTEKWFRCHLICEQSIDIRWVSLIQSTIIRELELYRCLSCNQYTHIIDHESNEILLNKELLVSDGKILAENDFHFRMKQR